MRRMTTILALLLVGAFLLFSQQIIVVKKKGGCTASYANEVITGEIWTAGPLVTEGDASTGWVSNSAPDVDNGAGTAHSGSYALHAVADANTEGVSYTFSGLTDEQLYKLSVWARHTGSGGAWQLGFGALFQAPRVFTVALTNSDQTYTNYTALFRYNAQTDALYATENSPTNDGGVYIDSFSVTAATPCLGSELFTEGNSASLSNEADSVGSWTGINSLNSLTSDGTGAKHGSYHILGDATSSPTANNGFNFDLSSMSLADSTKYVVLFNVRHIGSGDTWTCGFSSTSDGTYSTSYPSISILNSVTTYIGAGWEITYNSSQRYFVCHETGSNNNGGLYIDGFTVKQVVSE